jgi:hypothetical protein
MNWIIHETNWLRLAQLIKNQSTYALLVLLLAALVTLIGSKLDSGALLTLSRWMTAIVALLEVAVAVTATSLTRRVKLYWATHRDGMSDAGLLQLRGSLRKATSLMLLSWLIVISTACLPFAMGMVAWLPEIGLVFVPFALLLGMQWFNIRAYGELAMTVARNAYVPPAPADGI